MVAMVAILKGMDPMKTVFAPQALTRMLNQVLRAEENVQLDWGRPLYICRIWQSF